MENLSKPFILEDKSRLAEILELRLKSYKTHPLANEFNSKLFQNTESCSDIFDEKGIHFVIIHNESNEIAASYRLNIADKIEQLPYPKIFSPFNLPEKIPFLFYSRLVVHEKYRGFGLANKLQRALLNYHIESKISFGIGTAFLLVGWLQKYGFEVLGEIDTSLDKNYHYGKSSALIIYLEKIKI